MNPRLRYALFALICIAQLAVPLSMVVQHERTRSSGSAWRFQTAPVDPNDPFRGRYVQLSFAATREPVPMADTSLLYVQSDTRMYAELGLDAKGFAQLRKLHQQRPTSGEYMDVFVEQMAFRDGDDQAKAPPAARVRLSFDRYYLPEAQAPIVERDYGEATRKAQDNTYAEVRVRDGHAALVNLVLDGKPVSN